MHKLCQNSSSHFLECTFYIDTQVVIRLCITIIDEDYNMSLCMSLQD